MIITVESFKGIKAKRLVKKSGVGRKKIPKSLQRRTAVSSKKTTFAEIREQYGLPSYMKGKQSLRYTSPIERGILWYWFSRWIRELRDKDFPCISCAKEHEKYQGGHFIPAGSASCDDMVFDEMNVHKEGESCNQWDKRKLGYGINLDIRYGEGTKAKLERRYVQYKLGQLGNNWGKHVYREKIAHYRQLLAGLNSDSV